MELDFMSIKSEKIYRRIIDEINSIRRGDDGSKKMRGEVFGRACGYDNKDVAINFSSRIYHGKAVLTLPQFIAVCELLKIEPSALFDAAYAKESIRYLSDTEKDILDVFRRLPKSAQADLSKLLKDLL